MFEGSLVESTALLQSRNRWPALLSFTAQAVVALVIIAVPILHPELLPMHAPSVSLTPPPPPRPPQPPPPQRIRVEVAPNSAPSAPSAPAAQRSFLRMLLPSASSVADSPISTTIGLGMTGNSPIAPGIGPVPGSSPNVSAVAPKPSAPSEAIKLSSGVTAGLLLAPIRPDYPAIAKASRTEGTVVVHAIISRTGRIERAEVLSGSPMLQAAALEAVERAHYRPYLLNGQPTEVDTTITINFRLGS